MMWPFKRATWRLIRVRQYWAIGGAYTERYWVSSRGKRSTDRIRGHWTMEDFGGTS